MVRIKPPELGHRIAEEILRFIEDELGGIGDVSLKTFLNEGVIEVKCEPENVKKLTEYIEAIKINPNL